MIYLQVYSKYVSRLSRGAAEEMCQCLVRIIVVHNQGVSNSARWKSHFAQKGVAIDKFPNLQMNKPFIRLAEQFK